jgi:hypothetical protein
VYQGPHKSKKRGGVVNTQNNPFAEQPALAIVQPPGHTTEQQGFSTEDILWALGIWSVILCLSPVIAFYMLMVA